MNGSGYTAEGYAGILEALKASGFRFADFRDPLAKDERVVYLRHDIDYSPEWALAFARINARAGVTGTFFLRLRSPTYNLHAYSTLGLVCEICSLGQRVGLHYDVESGPEPTDEALVACIARDYNAMHALIPELAPVFNWHNPSLVPKVLERGLDLQVPGMINTYGRTFIERVKYYSDSNLRHSVEEFMRIICGNEPRLQLLLHPFQWLAEGSDMQAKLASTWTQVLREKEQEFLTNHVYRQLFPEGMPGEWLRQLSARIAGHRNP